MAIFNPILNTLKNLTTINKPTTQQPTQLSSLKGYTYQSPTQLPSFIVPNKTSTPAMASNYQVPATPTPLLTNQTE